MDIILKIIKTMLEFDRDTWKALEQLQEVAGEQADVIGKLRDVVEKISGSKPS